MAVSGVIDWVIQRISSIVISSYAIWMVFWMWSVHDIDYHAWIALYSNVWMQIYSVITVVATCAHAWIGMWTIGSDYLTVRQFGELATLVRTSYNIVCVVLLLLYVVWILYIMWNLT
ncbi:MAG: succinate dehydrogenase, hydrophobic membrane anchor protein [Gammaproteobacteria bacterium TMED1]|nr:MAG: succinate dehydrogenase, hydrophobic membrane anchor protein [Gammaproteobacteria bacterium TMED1]